MRHPILLVLLAGPFFTAASIVQAPELVAAAERGDAARVRALLESGASADARDEKGVTALLAAVRGGSTEVVRLLIRTGAHVDASTATGWTPLMESAARGRVEAAGLLIDAGADLDARDRFAGTALDVAQRADQPDMVRLLRGRGSRGSGRSVGSTVCIRPWKGNGFCGVITVVEATRYRVRVTGIRGCDEGCDADDACSEGRPVGGSAGTAVGDLVWVRGWCLTDTLVPDR